MTAILDIRQDNLSGGQTRELLALHMAGMHANSPPHGRFALDLSGLQTPGVRTHPRYLRRGVAAHLLDYVIAKARSRGLTRLSLETGSGPAFEPAWSLYTRRGLAAGGAFGDYPTNSFNRFLHLTL